jgi:hypothetical protein
MRSVAPRKYLIGPTTALNCSSKGVVYLLLLLLLHAGLWTAAAQQEDYISLRVRADPCVTISAFDQTALAPVKGERDGDIWNFRVPKGHWVEISVRTDGTCKVTGILEVARNLITPGERAFWYATYDADFEVRVEKPSLYVTVVGEPRECLSKVSTDPESRVEIANGTAKVGPFYRDSAVVLSVVPAERCEVVGMTVVGVPGSYGASSVNLWMTRDVEVRVTFRVIGAEKGGKETTTTIAPSPQRTSHSLPSIPHELLLMSILATSTVLGTFAAVRVLRKKMKERRDLEIREAPYVLRRWAHSGKITSVVLGLLSSEAAIKDYDIKELLTAAKKGTHNIEKLDRYQRGSSSLLTSDAFKNLNSDPIALHVATHLIAAGLIPTTYERRWRLRNELLPRWVRMIREGRYDDAVKEAHEFVRDLKRDPNEKIYSETIKKVEGNRHPFVQELINAALEELGEVIQPPVKEPERPAEREKAVYEQREAPVKAPALPITMKEEVKPKGPAELYALARSMRIRFVKVKASASVVGGAAIMAAFHEDANSLEVLAELMKISDLRVEPVDLETDAVYFPAERTDLEEAVVELTSKEHLACLVADAVGGTQVPPESEASLAHGAVIVDRGVDEDVLALARMARERGLPVRIATYSRERALLLASRLGIKAIGIKGLAETAAAFLLAVVGVVEPRFFRALVGFSLLVPNFKMRLRPPVTMEKLDAAPSSSCHPVKGLIHITRALKWIAAGKHSAVAKDLEKEMGELGFLAAAILELRWLDPSREGLTEVEVIEPSELVMKQESVIVEPLQEVPPDPDIILAHILEDRRIRAEVTPQVVGSIALKANEAALRGLIFRIRSGEISVHEDELPDGIYYPDEETAALISGLAEEEHMACVLAKALGRGFEVDIGGMPSGRLIATWSEERALELSSALGLPVFRIEYLPQILAYRVLEPFKEMKKDEMKMISPHELRMAVGLSLIFEGLPEAFSTRSLRIALAVVSHCGRHEVPRDLLMGLLSMDLVRLVTTMESERAVEEIITRTGLRSVEAEKLLRLLNGHFRERSLERVEVDPVDECLRFYRHQDGYWEIKVDGKRASERVAVQLGDGEMCVVPAKFEVIAIGMNVYELESLCKKPSIKNIEEDDIVIKVGKLFRGIKIERRDYEKRLLSLSDEVQGKLIPVGYFDYKLEHNLEEKGFKVVRINHKVRKQAEKGAERLLGEGVDDQVLRALTNILMYFPNVARAKGRTRSEVAENASKIIDNLLEDADDEGYRNFLRDAVRTLIGERRLLKLEEIDPKMRRMRKIIEALELCDPCSSRRPSGGRRSRRS